MTISSSVLLSLFLLPLSISQNAPLRAADEVTVKGRVLDSNGRPVADALVSAYPPNAELHRVARTAVDGTFRFQIEPFGAGVITAMKPEDGYPDPAATLYGREDEDMLPINATLAASPIQVELRVGERDAMVQWTVVSKADRSPIRFAQFRIGWSDDPKKWLKSSTSDAGVLKVVLPKHPVTITISAKGFREWNSAESKEFGGPVLFTPGTKDERTILLEPEGQ